jgi:hypothetical protein
VLCFQPAMIRGGELIDGSAFDHRDPAARDVLSPAHIWTTIQVENRNYRK